MECRFHKDQDYVTKRMAHSRRSINNFSAGNSPHPQLSGFLAERKPLQVAELNPSACFDSVLRLRGNSLFLGNWA